MTDATVSAEGAPTSAAAPARKKAKRKDRGGIPLFRWLTKNPVWDIFILLCIVANAAILGYDAHYGETNPYHAQIELWNMYFLWIFTAELVLEFFATGPRRYFASGWNWFDMIVVGLSYIAVNPAISALRTLRVVRVFRLISAVPQMRRVVEALFSAMPGILATFAILSIVFYIGAVMATTLFHNEDGFRDLGESALSLFALSQFDGWGDTIARLQPNYPFAWFFVMSFTVIAAFAVLNLFVGVIVEAVQQAPQEEIKDEIEEVQEEVGEIATAQEDAAVVQQRILEEVRALRAEVAALRGPPAT
ncbi:MAG: ion transporter [Hyphomonadaceae bacterium JAD_PAG50586_4]|nr:MAG: ion transporter [Hyphomonadaceae bacterium JAD_PAG50586_4]